MSSYNYNTYAQKTKPTLEEEKWIEKGYKNTKITNFNINVFYYGNEKFTYAMDLILVNLRGSGWDKQNIKKTISKVAEVYLQCGIKIGSAKYVEADAPYGLIDFSKKEFHHYALAFELPLSERPVIFFAKSNLEEKSAFANSNRLEDPPVSNTVFILSKVNSKEYKEKRPEDYSPTAHELAHLFCDCPHNDIKEPNILSKYYDVRDNSISKEQCATFKSKGLELGILRKL